MMPMFASRNPFSPASSFSSALFGVLLAALLGPASGLAVAATSSSSTPAPTDHISVKTPFELPPSADLHYTIKARQKGFTISGDATISWRKADAKYTLTEETRASFFGKILENRSHGQIDAFGIAPLEHYEKRIRKDPWTATFHRDSKTITFTESKLSYPIKGGEQDRTTAPWQLLAMARANPDKFVAGSEWSMFVAGRRDAEQWTFKVVRPETIRTALGPLETIHLTKVPPADSKDQDVDIWLAPSQNWFPVRLRFTDGADEFVEQTIESITRK
jgi:hypothetical protein